MTRSSWILGILCVLMIVIVANYIRLVYVMSNHVEVYDALPESSSIILEFNNISKTLSKVSVASFNEDIFEASFLKKLKNQINYIDSLTGFVIHDSLVPEDEEIKLLASLNLIGKNDLDYLYLIRHNGMTEDDVKRKLTQAKAGFSVKKRTFRSEEILEFSLQGYREKLTCIYLKGIFIASFTPFLVEEAIVQLKDKRSILKEPGFYEVKELGVRGADVLIYLNFANLDLFQPLLINNKSAKYMPALTSFGDWLELDLKISENGIIVNGYAVLKESRKTTLSKFSKEPSSTIEVTRILPFNTSVFFYLSVETFENYLSHYIANISIGNLNYFKNWIGNEWCFGILEPFDENYEEEGFLAIKASDIELASESLKELVRLGLGDEGYINYNDFEIRQLTIKDELNNVLDHDFVRITDPYYTIIDKHVLFASKLSVLKTIISQYLEGRSMAKDPDYLSFESNLTTSSNYYVYVNISRSGEILSGILSEVLVAAMNKGDKKYMKFSPVGFQFSYYDDVFFTNGYISFQSQMEESANRIWQTKLEANAAIPPVLVLNHYTNDKEIFVQDELNNIYLITKSGKILWSKTIDDIIISKVYQIDFYENTKLQYLFNTKNHIHLVDRTGENVAGYPLKLPAEASNGLLLVDYDNKKDYRFFIACKNSNVYGYYRGGKPLPGWNPQSNVGLIRYPLKHILADGKDYIIAATEEGAIYYFDRRGERRVSPVELKTHFYSDFQVVQLGSTFQLFNVDKEGNLYKVYRNGTFSVQNHGITSNFFDIQHADLKQDGKHEFLFIDSSIVKVYDIKFSEIFTSSFPSQIDQPGFVVSYNTGKVGFGLLSRRKQSIYLMDEDLAFHSAFPLPGCTGFITSDLYETGRKVIVVGGCNGHLNAYQIR